MELRVDSVAIPEKVSFNYEELKAELTEKVHMYETLVYDDTQIKDAKEDRASLNKLKKSLNDERIRLEKEYMKPFNVFKTQVAEIIGIIDKPIEVIDKQIKAYEEEEKNKKLEKIKAFYSGDLQDDLTTRPPEWLTLEMIFDDRWLNKSVSIATAKDDIVKKVQQVSNDLATLSNLPEFGFEASEVYKSTLDVNKALNEGQRLAEIQKRKQEQEELKKQQEQAAKVEEPKPEPIPEPVEKTISETEARAIPQWVNFSAYITVDQAIALKEFFDTNNIQFKAI